METVETSKVLVRNQKGLYLVLRSSEWPGNPRRSLQPDLPGGLVEAGETAETAAARELYEEAGIRSDPGNLRLWSEDTEGTGKVLLKRRIYFFQADNPEVILSWEHDKYWWKNKDELLSMKWRTPYSALFEKMAASSKLV